MSEDRLKDPNEESLSDPPDDGGGSVGQVALEPPASDVAASDPPDDGGGSGAAV
jgi:hypothetical protein